MKSDDLASISSEENCPEENFNDCSDLENYVGNFESKKVPQDWDKEVGLKLLSVMEIFCALNASFLL